MQYQMRGLAMPSSFSFFAASDACFRPRSVSELDTAILNAGFVARTPAASASSSAALTQVYELRRGATGGSSNKPVLPVENSSSTTDGVNSCGSAKAGAAIEVVPPTRSSRRVGTRRAAAVAARRRARRAVIAGRFCSKFCAPSGVLLIQSLAAVRGPSFLHGAQSADEVKTLRHSRWARTCSAPRCASRKSARDRKSRVFTARFNLRKLVQGVSPQPFPPLGTARIDAFGASSHSESAVDDRDLRQAASRLRALLLHPHQRAGPC